MTNLSIKDLATLSGLKPHTIRIWERRYSFFRPKRNSAFRRYYSLSELNTLLDIILLNKNGHKMSHIAKMSTTEKQIKIEGITAPQIELKTINELIICMAEMATERFEEVLNSCVCYLGLHETIEKIIVPFSEKAGLFDSLDKLRYLENAALIREPIKEKIYSGLEATALPKDFKEIALLFSMRGSGQSLMLLYLRYFLKLNGVRCSCPDISLTFKQLELICFYTKPDWIILEFLETKDTKSFMTFAEGVLKQIPNLRLITFGDEVDVSLLNILHHHARNLPEAVSIVKDGLRS